MGPAGHRERRMKKGLIKLGIQFLATDIPRTFTLAIPIDTIIFYEKYDQMTRKTLVMPIFSKSVHATGNILKMHGQSSRIIFV